MHLTAVPFLPKSVREPTFAKEKLSGPLSAKNRYYLLTTPAAIKYNSTERVIYGCDMLCARRHDRSVETSIDLGLWIDFSEISEIPQTRNSGFKLRLPRDLATPP